MKTNLTKISFAILFAFVLQSCGDSNKSNNKESINYHENSDSSNENNYPNEIEETNSELNSISEMDELSSESNSNTEIDEALNSYEEYVDQYIIFLKKAQKGDNLAMAEYPSLMQKANDWSEKLEDMKGDFNSSQISRMMKIQTKITNAALEMQ